MLTEAAAESSLFPLSTLRIPPESRSETLVGISPIIIGCRRGLIPRKTVMYTLPKGKKPLQDKGLGG